MTEYNKDHGDDLRALFADATADVRPQGTLEEIQARTGAATRTPWLMPAAAAAVVVGLAIGGISWALHDDSTAARTPGVLSHPEKPRTRSVFYLADTPAGPRLYSEPTVTADDLAAATDAISGKAADPDYRSAWPAGTVVNSIGRIDKNTIGVEFGAGSVLTRPAGMTSEVALLSIQQLVRTVQAQFDFPASVTFYTQSTATNGTAPIFQPDHRIDHLLGVDTSAPSGGVNDAAVLAPVQIASPINGSVIHAGPVEVSGLASTFEANVLWKVLDSSGAVVKHGFTTAAECCTLSPYSFTVVLAPGTYTIVVHDTDESGAGRPVNQDTKEIIVE